LKNYIINIGEKTKNNFKEVNAAMATNINDNAERPISINLLKS
jgi:hypothetical protein